MAKEVLPLHLKYRPTDWHQMVGQNAVVDSVQEVVEGGAQRAFLFWGPSGCGKTTLARIVSAKVGARMPLEIDAATNTGIDAMRSVLQTTQYQRIGGDPHVVIIDEAHALSKSAWQAMLKSIEEPGVGVFWILCTTEPKKVPKNIETRCAVYELRTVNRDEMLTLLKGVAFSEKDDADPPLDAVLDVCVQHAQGSPRAALVAMEQVWCCGSAKEASELLSEAHEGQRETIDLCRALMRGERWGDLMEIVRGIEKAGLSPESVRMVVLSYFSKVVMKQSSLGDKAETCLAVLAAFRDSYLDAGTSMAPVLLSLGQLFGGND